MKSLIKTEWLKIKHYRAFWWLVGITALSYPGINYLFYFIFNKIGSGKDQAAKIAKMLLGNPFTFPEAWHTVAYFSSIFVFIPAVVVIMFITNEYTFKTHRQNIIDGWSRKQFISSKMMDVLIISIIVTILYIVIAFVVGFINTDDVAGNIWSMSYYIPLFFLQTFSQLSLAFMVGYLVRKAFISLGIFLFYFMILEPIFVNLGKFKLDDIFRFLPLEISDRIIPVPAFIGKFGMDAYNKSLEDIPVFIILTIILTTIVWFLCYRINNRRDL